MKRRDFLDRAWRAPVAIAGTTLLPGLFKAPQKVTNIVGNTFNGISARINLASIETELLVIRDNLFR